MFYLLFMLMYLSSFLIVSGAESWFLLWVGLEINMLSFISLIYKKSILNIEVSLKYFFIQSLGSAILLMVMILKMNLFKEIIQLILLYKMGSGPFFFWFPSFCEGISWHCCILMMSLQKLIPLIFVDLFMCSSMWFFLIMSMFIGVMGCFNEIKLKKFMAYSSIHYVGWLLLCIMLSSYLWIFYLFMYLLMLYGIFFSLGWMESIIISDLLKLKSCYLFIFSMLNMGGMPPMLGFYMKWWVFLMLLDFNIEVLWMIIMMVVLMLYVYIRLVYPMMVEYLYFKGYWGKDFNKKSFKLKEWLYMFGMMSPSVLWLFF